MRRILNPFLYNLTQPSKFVVQFFVCMPFAPSENLLHREVSNHYLKAEGYLFLHRTVKCSFYECNLSYAYVTKSLSGAHANTRTPAQRYRLSSTQIEVQRGRESVEISKFCFVFRPLHNILSSASNRTFLSLCTCSWSENCCRPEASVGLSEQSLVWHLTTARRRSSGQQARITSRTQYHGPRNC